jgi:hypothetical protein
MTRLLHALAIAVAASLVAPEAAAASQKACETGGKMVETFAMFRDQHKPISDVDAYIDNLPGVRGDKEQSDFYKKLARATYAKEGMSPAQARESFIGFCLDGH